MVFSLSLLSIKAEIEVLLERYRPISEEIQNSEQQLNAAIIINGDYFTVYNNNCDRIGDIKKESLKKSIIKFYVDAKELIDTLELNSQMQKERKEDLKYLAPANFPKTTEVNLHKRKQECSEKYDQLLNDFLPKIKQSNSELKKLANDAIKGIDEEISIY